MINTVNGATTTPAVLCQKTVINSQENPSFKEPVDTVTISSLENTEHPPSVLSLPTSTGEVINFHAFTDYTPTPSHRLPIRNPELASLLEGDINLGENFGLGSPSYNIEDLNDLGPYIFNYIGNHQEILAGLQISNLKSMTPEQAAALAACVVGEHYNYDDGRAAEMISPAWDESADNSSMLERLQSGEAICGDYASTTVAIFDLFKNNLPNLQNAYMFTTGGAGNDEGREYITGHTWCSLVILTEDAIVIKSIDPTAQDVHGSGIVDVMRDGTPLSNIGTQIELIWDLYYSAAIIPEEAIRGLKTYIENNPNSPRLFFAHYRLAELLTETGNYSGAEAQLQHIIDNANNPDNPLGNNAQEVLATLRDNPSPLAFDPI